MSPDRPAGLTTHVLDTSRGRPAAGLRIDLLRLDPEGRARPIKTVTTNADGRADAPLLAPAEMPAGPACRALSRGGDIRAVRRAPTRPPGLPPWPPPVTSARPL